MKVTFRIAVVIITSPIGRKNETRRLGEKFPQSFQDADGMLIRVPSTSPLACYGIVNLFDGDLFLFTVPCPFSFHCQSALVRRRRRGLLSGASTESLHGLAW